MQPIRMGILGVGKIAPDQQRPMPERPLQLVSDIFLVAKQIPVESFEERTPS